jgi:hypothetical protein
LAILGRSRAGLVLGLVGWWFLSGRGRGFGRGLVLKRENPGAWPGLVDMFY